MTITSIRQVNNETVCWVRVRSEESSKKVMLQPMESKGTDLWVPWCSNENDFKNRHYIMISVSETPSSDDISPPYRNFGRLWQNGGQVHFAEIPKGFPEGRCVHSNCVTGGDRLLIVRGGFMNATIEVTNLP